jgi:hypothetical protein
MTEVLCLHKTGPSTADIILSVFRVGSFITGGRSETITVKVQDNDNLRSISANLNHMKKNNYPGLVTVNFGKGQRYDMDQSVWHELANALFAFSLCVDCANLGV